MQLLFLQFNYWGTLIMCSSLHTYIYSYEDLLMHFMNDLLYLASFKY